jgi:hypothetical protein
MSAVPHCVVDAIEVPLLDLKAQYAEIEREVLESLRAVCAGQRFILGPCVSELEGRIAEYSWR